MINVRTFSRTNINDSFISENYSRIWRKQKFCFEKIYLRSSTLLFRVSYSIYFHIISAMAM